MNHQQQALAALVQADVHGTQQWAITQIQAALGFVTQALERLPISCMAAPEQRQVECPHVSDTQTRLLTIQTQTQRRVALQQDMQRTLQCSEIQRLAGLQQDRLIPVVAQHSRYTLEEASLHRGQRRATGGRCVDGGRRRGDFRHLACLQPLRQLPHGLPLEQLLGTELETQFADARDDLQAEDGITTQLEEVVFGPDPFDLEHRLPDRRQLAFQFAQRHLLARFASHVRTRQCLAIDLTIGSQR